MKKVKILTAKTSAEMNLKLEDEMKLGWDILGPVQMGIGFTATLFKEVDPPIAPCDLIDPGTCQ